MSAKQPDILYMSELYLYRDGTGWHYKALSPLDFHSQAGSSFEQRLAERHAYGPFATAEQAARDAVTQLGLKPGGYAGFADLAAQHAPGSEIHRAAAALEELLNADDGGPALPAKP